MKYSRAMMLCGEFRKHHIDCKLSNQEHEGGMQYFPRLINMGASTSDRFQRLVTSEEFKGKYGAVELKGAAVLEVDVRNISLTEEYALEMFSKAFRADDTTVPNLVKAHEFMFRIHRKGEDDLTFAKLYQNDKLIGMFDYLNDTVRVIKLIPLKGNKVRLES